MWQIAVIGAGVAFLIFYANGVRLYLQGQGREHFESGVKALLTLKENGGRFEIARRGQGVIVYVYREDGQMNWADIRLRVPSREWSSPYSTALTEAFIQGGYEVLKGSAEWITEVRILVDNIWAVGSAAKGAEAANLALDVLGFAKEDRFNQYIKGKANWRFQDRQGPSVH